LNKLIVSLKFALRFLLASSFFSDFGQLEICNDLNGVVESENPGLHLQTKKLLKESFLSPIVIPVLGSTVGEHVIILGA
jgi:hypothetical protein